MRHPIESMSDNNMTEYTNANISISDEDLAQKTIFVGYPDGTLRFAAVCCIMFMIIGIPGNLITIFALWRCKQVRNATAKLIINQTFSDLINCCVNLPLAANTFWTERWLHGLVMCKVFAFLRFALFAVSYFTVLAITINRYILLEYPHTYSRLFTKRNLRIIISCTWIFSFGPVIPALFGVFGCFGMDPVSGYCDMLPDHNQVNPRRALFLIAFVIPSVAIVVCYSRIYYLVRKTTSKSQKNKKPAVSDLSFADSSQESEPNRDSKRKSATSNNIKDLNNVKEHPRVTSLRFGESTVISMPDSNSNGALSRGGGRLTRSKLQLSHFRKLLPTSKDKRLLSMITAIVLSFVVCNLPITAVKMYNELQPHPVAFIFSTILKYLTICINPLVYVVMSYEYRKVYKKVFDFKKCKEIKKLKCFC